MYELFLTLHLIGVIFGAGSALVSDTLFFGVIRDRNINTTELKLLSLVSSLVWIGVGILVISGFVMLVVGDFVFLGEPSFQMKMLLVTLVIINGILFHKHHIPFLKKMVKVKNLEDDISDNVSDRHHFKYMFVSGAISMISWLAIIILGSMQSIDLSFFNLLLIYLGSLGVSILASQLILQHLFPKHHPRKEKKHSFHRGIWAYILFTLVMLFAFISFYTLFGTNQSISNNRVDTTIELTPKSELEVSTNSHVAYAPEVPPSSSHTNQKFFEVKLEVLENVCTIDDENNLKHDTWGYRVEGDDEIFCGSPGPVLRGRVGDMARITLTNPRENIHPHNIDFHAVTGQGGGARDLTVAPGETASIDVRLLYPGSFMYHCAYGDVPVHIARGMSGMFIVDPAEPLPEVDHEWSVMQSEWYLTDPDEDGNVDLDRERLFEETPNLITFNGRTDALLGDNALNMNVGERARIYFVNEGLNKTSNFHPIGSHWDIVYPEGATHPANTVIHGSQSTSVVAGGGTVVELVAQVPSDVVLVDHALTRAFYKGAKGVISIAGEENHEIYEVSRAPQSLEEKEEEETSIANAIQVIIPKGSSAPTMADRAYQPNYVKIKKGETITWTNKDSVMHTVTSGTSDGSIRNPDGKFYSDVIRPGKTFTHTFNEVGEFPYYCSPHPWAQGTVVVEE